MQTRQHRINTEFKESTTLFSFISGQLNIMEKIQTKWLVLLHVVIFFFGVSAWLGINSTYVQLPLLVEVAPEQWSLPSFIVISIQIANIGPILYTTLQNRKLCKDSTLIGVILLIGLIGVLLFGFLYEKTAIVFGKERSVSILVLVFALALVGCTSSVLFMPYMGRLKEIYLVTYLIGEGASGLVPSIIALIQGVGGNTICVPSSSSKTGFEEYTPPPRFGVQTFYNIIFVVFCLSLIAYLLLEFFPVFKHEYSTVSIDHGNNYLYNAQKESEKNTEELKKLSSFNYAFLLILLGMICTLVNGFFPSVQSYSCLPYGNVAYHLAVTLSQISNPLACFLAFFIPYKSIRTISYLTLFSMIFVVYLLFTTFMHPPPLRGTNLGVILVVVCWVLTIGIHSFVRLAITSIFRQQGGRSLVWVGSVTQIGSFIGSTVAFILINFTDLFKQYSVCDGYSK